VVDGYAEGLDLAGDAEELLSLHAELLRRLEDGESPALDEYLRHYPEHAPALRRFWARWQRVYPQLRPDRGGPEDLAPETSAGLPLLLPATGALELPGLEVYEKLGEGGMGQVYRARDVRLDRPRAVKVIRTGPLGGDRERDRFNREARAVARLDHPGVVRIYALSEHEGTLYICMELLEGGSLQDRLRRGPLEIRAAADVVRQLALAVQHAHEHRVLHRDLKPANVLLTADGTPKIGDFGLAKLLDADDGLTHTGATLGTPAYMAPEQAEGRLGDVREHTDVWALGVIFYECLTGKRPFRGEGRSETLELIKKQPPVPPRRLRAEVPAGLEAVCLRCLQKPPGQRYAGAAALAADLQNWLDGRPVAPRPRRRRRPWLVAAPALLLAAGLGVGSLLLLPGPKPGAGPDPPAAADVSWKPGVWHPLLTREPAALRWPTPGKNSHKLYDPVAQELVLSCEELGLIPLGRTDASHYRLAITVQQNPWAGNVGLFFGCRDPRPAGAASAPAYQYLKLVALPQTDQGRQFRVDWKAFDLGRFRGDNVYRNSLPFRLGPGEFRLEMEVGPEGLATVAVNGKVLPEVNAADVPPPPPPPADYKGLFGVYVYTGNGVFRKAEYLFYEEP
jgi:serine/threonine-protein kinase